MPATPSLTIRPSADLTHSGHLVVIAVRDRPAPHALLTQVASVAGEDVAAAVGREDESAATIGGHRIVRVGGEANDFADAAASIAAKAATEPLDLLLLSASSEQAAAFARGLTLGSQRLGDSPAPELTMWVPGPTSRIAAAEVASTVAGHILAARQWANTPSNIKTPTWLAEQAHAVAGGKLRTTTYDPQWLAQQGFGGLLAVGQGSVNPPNLTRLDYQGRPGGPHIVLVGKGITFDSGGLSLKPAASMPLMKTDMSGAAAVIATLAAIRDAGLPVRVTGLIACAENMPGAAAMRPGDVVRHYGGRTTEVLNTDAEGRLVLADSLAYAADVLRPDFMIDLATLTGAATVGLGRQHAALFTTSPRMARALTAAGESSGDRVWRLPLVREYEAAIASDIADAANTNTDAVTQAGAITAALFLQPFVAGIPWAHLDIAGAGRTESDRPNCRKGATGFGVALLTNWIRTLAR